MSSPPPLELPERLRKQIDASGRSFDAGRALADRSVGGVDQRAIESAVIALLHAIGENPARDGLSETPARVARAWSEFTGGMRIAPHTLLDRTFTAHGSDRDLILQRAIPFYSLCEHHLVPFYGEAAVAYIPNESSGKIVGLSKLVRVVRAYAARLQVQERLTSQIADTVFEALRAQGVAVVVRAEHLCIGMRGIRAPGSITITSAMRGLFFEDARARDEITQLIG